MTKPRTGRRPGDSGTRSAILAAAREAFAQRGYGGATFRGIAAQAGVDPALIRHYYGTKENLFAAAMQLPMSPADALDEAVRGDPEQLGERILAGAMSVWEQPQARYAALGVIRAAATYDQAAGMVRQFVERAIVHRIANALDSPEAELRASLSASQVAGLIVTRYLLQIEPIASLPAEQVRAAVAPTLQRYLTGAL